MFKVNKQEEPQFFKDFKRKNKPKNWDDYNSDIKKQLKKWLKINII